MVALFATSQALLMESFPAAKVQGVRELYDSFLADSLEWDGSFPVFSQVESGAPPLEWVEPKFLKRRGPNSIEGRAAMLHAIVHIEFNAINLALDAIARFRGMPKAYYGDWLKVAREEAYHFCLLTQHLHQMGFQYGDFPVHKGLWEMAQQTAYDVLARMALVPRLLEARGLDVAPAMAKRLQQAGDTIAAEILGIIFQDEIGHVAIGNRWFHYLCEQRQCDPLSTFSVLLQRHAPDYLRGPLALEARRRAGFQEPEIELITKIIELREIS